MIPFPSRIFQVSLPFVLHFAFHRVFATLPFIIPITYRILAVSYRFSQLKQNTESPKGINGKVLHKSATTFQYQGVSNQNGNRLKKKQGERQEELHSKPDTVPPARHCPPSTPEPPRSPIASPRPMPAPLALYPAGCLLTWGS